MYVEPYERVLVENVMVVPGRFECKAGRYDITILQELRGNKTSLLINSSCEDKIQQTEMKNHQKSSHKASLLELKTRGRMKECKNEFVGSAVWLVRH